MAGYVFSIGDAKNAISTVRDCAESGVFSSHLKPSDKNPNLFSFIPFEGTLTDYCSMQPGDNIYFFCKRKYYGIGKLVSIGPDCKYCNFPGASTPFRKRYDNIRDNLIMDYEEESPNYPWICTFVGDPYFFADGIDTDEILSYKPATYKMLRAFWKVSFIKLGEEENNSLKEIFLLRNQTAIKNRENIYLTRGDIHRLIEKKVNDSYLISPNQLLERFSEHSKISHEMAVEAAVVYDLTKDRIPLLGRWDYVSHQVIASPFKPIDYMDKIDVFAIRYLPETKIPCKHLVIELKKDSADKSTIDQVMKYVDWVCNEYGYGDYSSVEAAIIAHDYPDGIADYFHEVALRYYTLGSHPVRNSQWSSLKLIRYEFVDGEMRYVDETPKA